MLCCADINIRGFSTPLQEFKNNLDINTKTMTMTMLITITIIANANNND